MPDVPPKGRQAFPLVLWALTRTPEIVAPAAAGGVVGGDVGAGAAVDPVALGPVGPVGDDD